MPGRRLACQAAVLSLLCRPVSEASRKQPKTVAWPILSVLASFALMNLSFCHKKAAARPITQFEIVVLGPAETPVPCRVHLRDDENKIVKPGTWPAFDDHFVYSGQATFPLPIGTYRYEIERGPEFQSVRGSFRVAEDGPKSLRVRIERIADLASQGWYSGDLHIHRRGEDMPLLVRAEDLKVAPVVTWWNSIATTRPALFSSKVGEVEAGSIIDETAGEDERQGGALLFFRLAKPLPLPPSMRGDRGQIIHQEGDARDEYPSPTEFAWMARSQPGAHIDIEKPFWWDVPTWVAHGFADSIEIAYNQMTRASLHNGEAWGKQRDLDRYSGPLGDAYFTQDVYYHILDAGIRLAPSAGSASGALPNPVGYDRVYVHLDGALDYEEWWRALKAGHSFVTNGPILLVRANGELPGHVFASSHEKSVELVLETRVLSNEPVGRVELVRDGRVVATGVESTGGTVSFPPLSFEQSGWFLVRTIANSSNNFRFASTAPFYVGIEPNTHRISRASVQYFIDWVDERMNRLRGGSMPPDELQSVLAFHQEAARFWRQQRDRANAD
jgi:hypothetical protein